MVGSPTSSWFVTTFDPTTSSDECFAQVTYQLCSQVSGNACSVAWANTTRIYIDGDQVKILIEPFPREEVYVLVNYQLGQKYAVRKIDIAVCGTENV